MLQLNRLVMGFTLGTVQLNFKFQFHVAASKWVLERLNEAIDVIIQSVFRVLLWVHP